MRRLLYGDALFFPVRSIYQVLFDRRKRADRRRMLDFYAAFVYPGDLVFDVGAHVGNYSDVFSELGAKVVAVEPNPECWENLRRLARARQVYVEQCAVGEVPGRAALRLSESSGLSTLSDRWYDSVGGSAPNRDLKWFGTRQVEVVTLDQLMARYGVPSFLKIDAEGYDDEVLRGMSLLPRALSFEFHRRAPEVAMRCLETAALVRFYRFNYVRGLEMKFACESWLHADELRDRLEVLVGHQENGDVLARRID
jgi:FkbM family methyltransferase